MTPPAIAPAAQTDPTPSDESLVQRILAGETVLFEVLVRRHNQRLFRAVRSVLHDDAEVEEVMQHAYVAAFDALATFRGEARFSTWLVRIAINEAFARVRRGRRFVALDGGESASEGPGGGGAPPRTPEERAIDRQMLAVVEAAIDALPEGYREVLVLREVDGRSTADVAACLDVSEEVVKTRLHRARTLLRDRIERRIGDTVRNAFGFDGWRCDRLTSRVMAAIADRPGPRP